MRGLQQPVARPGLADRSPDGIATGMTAPADRPVYTAAKRTFDILFASTMLIITAPIWLTVALLIRVTSPGPILFRQLRAGQHGQPFLCYKFRTMTDGADAQKDSLQHLNEMSGPVFKIRSDPRITSVGRWLRKSSIDELPQLINVLKGEMSVVGPRPLPVHESNNLNDFAQQRLIVKPGLTCVWQVSGRSDVDFNQWMNLDVEYIQHRSFSLDVLLILRTVVAVISMRGAK